MAGCASIRRRGERTGHPGRVELVIGESGSWQDDEGSERMGDDTYRRKEVDRSAGVDEENQE